MSAPKMQSEPESPLLIRFETEFTAIGFGRVYTIQETAQLQRDLNSILDNTVGALPSSLAGKSAALLDVYSGGRKDFFSLFYVPIWSFLHWMFVDRPDASADLKNTARTAHAMSLFLHLWDDHLCDGQLEVDIARLQLRTIAWQRFTAAAYKLCNLVGQPSEVVDEHANEYLSSQSGSAKVADVDNYLQLFSRQIATWTLVPRLLDHWLGDAQNSNSLQNLIDLFAGCWRLVDDIQDINIDLLAGKRNAVWYQLDSAGRTRWEQCRAH